MAAPRGRSTVSISCCDRPIGAPKFLVGHIVARSLKRPTETHPTNQTPLGTRNMTLPDDHVGDVLQLGRRQVRGTIWSESRPGRERRMLSTRAALRQFGEKFQISSPN